MNRPRIRRSRHSLRQRPPAISAKLGRHRELQRTDAKQTTRRVVDAAFDQIATNGRLPFKGPAAESANRKAKLVADRQTIVNMHHDDALTAYLLSQLSASFDQAEDERIRFKEIDDRFNEFATSGATRRSLHWPIQRWNWRSNCCLRALVAVLRRFGDMPFIQPRGMQKRGAPE